MVSKEENNKGSDSINDCETLTEFDEMRPEVCKNVLSLLYGAASPTDQVDQDCVMTDETSAKELEQEELRMIEDSCQLDKQSAIFRARDNDGEVHNLVIFRLPVWFFRYRED